MLKFEPLFEQVNEGIYKTSSSLILIVMGRVCTKFETSGSAGELPNPGSIAKSWVVKSPFESGGPKVLKERVRDLNLPWDQVSPKWIELPSL